MYEYRWNGWNIEHIGEHGVSPEEAEHVVDHSRSPWPQYIGGEKWLVKGQSAEGYYLQVIYTFDPEDVVYVIHARPLTDNEKRALRRRRRKRGK